MMTQFARSTHTRFLKHVGLILLLFVMSACTLHKEGTSRSVDYLSMTDCCGILLGSNNENPEFIINETVGIKMLTDQRIIGSWSFQEGVNNVVLLSDGTATTTTPSFYTRSGSWQWVTANVILITYSTMEYDVMRFNIVDEENGVAVVTIFAQDSLEPISFMALKDQPRANL